MEAPVAAGLGRQRRYRRPRLLELHTPSAGGALPADRASEAIGQASSIEQCGRLETPARRRVTRCNLPAILCKPTGSDLVSKKSYHKAGNTPRANAQQYCQEEPAPLPSECKGKSPKE